MRHLTWPVRRWGHRQALANARAASIALSRARVERTEIDLYLARHRARWDAAHAAGEGA